MTSHEAREWNQLGVNGRPLALLDPAGHPKHPSALAVIASSICPSDELRITHTAGAVPAKSHA